MRSFNIILLKNRVWKCIFAQKETVLLRKRTVSMQLLSQVIAFTAPQTAHVALSWQRHTAALQALNSPCTPADPVSTGAHSQIQDLSSLEIGRAHV